MSAAWFWIALAASGALHGLSPASGWIFAAARPDGRLQALHALLPSALGHLAALGLAAAGAAQALTATAQRNLSLATAGLLLLLMLAARLHPGLRRTRRISAGCCALALWSFALSGAHGAGMMLPALMPLCGDAGSASGTLARAMAAVFIHTAAMLASAAAAAGLACQGRRLWQRLRRAPAGPCARPATGDDFPNCP
ncbi:MULTISPECIES: hypothetical protein [unclassified Herbaspirillum]|uniref:hypothetical protein n=1 Tax=unclassified Herbaspirillum TaxID=2624150 RepID=UPI00114E835F|nr:MULTISPECIES: hypothetical protein [unclassified Herbaspirillum]MBB5391714.1 DMSO/TMAO reductase YedYZ heme-binding membrane subunit [Herbaspirillum sp. SJZ102]TQK03039.1 hypothetical protein FB599_3706 [Herbaspirillum sp. SJZ130]TQK06573.1 hypothetical protein FB598_3579 [Herbaspirillum sp. SJZ106]